MKTAFKILFAFSLLIMTSCGRERIFFEYKTIDETRGWDKNDKKVFQAEIEDTLGVYDI